jgi:hypothetical protein
MVQLTDKGRALQQQAKQVPQCILKASGRSLEQLQQAAGRPAGTAREPAEKPLTAMLCDGRSDER